MTDDSTLDDFDSEPSMSYEDEYDPLFDDPQDEKPQIFARRELVEIGHVPSEKRIVGRENEIQSVGQYLRPVVNDDAPSSFIIYGKTGTGKSLVSRHVAMRARASGERRGNRIGVVYIDCSQDSTETQAACSIARGLNEESSTGIAVPRTGLGRSHYYARLWDILDQRFDAVIIILDEIDRLKADDGEDNILMQLSRAREAGKTSVNIGIIGISNKINYRDRLNERVKSSFGDDELVFNPYDANQLRQIMEARRDAFVDGVIEEGVISKAAALAAREHGDARKAIRILRNAGEFAERNGYSTVREEHLDAAQKRAEVDRLQELLSGLTPHTKYALMGLATLTANNPEDEFRTSVIYDAYRSVCADAGSETLTLYRVRDLLREQSFLEIIESYHTGGGRGGGSYTVHQLLKEPEIVFECVDTGAEDE